MEQFHTMLECPRTCSGKYVFHFLSTALVAAILPGILPTIMHLAFEHRKVPCTTWRDHKLAYRIMWSPSNIK